MTPHRPRLIGSALLGTRKAAGVLVSRHPDLVRKRCQPVACDVPSKALLYDLDAVADTFSATPRRVA